VPVIAIVPVVAIVPVLAIVLIVVGVVDMVTHTVEPWDKVKIGQHRNMCYCES